RRIEHDNRGRSLFGVFGLERARAVQEPDIVLRVDCEARRISELELRRQLRPRSVNLEHRNAARLGLRRLRSRLGSEKPSGWDASSDEVRPETNETESPTLHGFLLSHPIRSPCQRARAASVGTVRSIALAACWLITSSNLTACRTGNSAGFAPLMIC